MSTSHKKTPLKNNRNITITLGIVIVMIGFIWIMNFLKGNGKTLGDTTLSSQTNEPTYNVAMQDGIQIITIDVGHGYIPAKTTAKAGIPTKIIFQGKNAYGCESGITIPELGYRKNITPNGSDMTDIPSQEIWSSLNIVCSMGMYSANIDFI